MSRRTGWERLVRLLVALPTTFWLAQSTPTSAADGEIAGQVVDGDTGQAVAGVSVTISGSSVASRSESTTVSGAFAFRDIVAGAYFLAATKPGYEDGAYRRQWPGDMAALLELSRGERVPNVVIRVWKHAVISGTVVEESGDPLVGVEIQILRRRLIGGKPEFFAVGSAVTDDRGIYRAPELQPGEYLAAVSSVRATYTDTVVPDFTWSARRASVQTPGGGVGQSNGLPVRETANGRLEVVPSTFFSAALHPAQATTIRLRSGDESVADFRLRWTPAFTVSGRLVGPAGSVRLAAVRLMLRDHADVTSYSALEVASTVAGEDGSFRLDGVPIGSYLVRVWKRRELSSRNSLLELDRALGDMRAARAAPPDARPKPPPAERELWASQDVLVEDRDVSVEVPLAAAPRVHGRYVFEGARQPPIPEAIGKCLINLVPASGRSPELVLPGPVDNSGTFTTYGVPAGRYVVSSSCAFPGWFLDGAWYQQTDHLEVPMELRDRDLTGLLVKFVDASATLAGSVSTVTGLPDEQATVIVFPRDRAKWQDYGSSSRRMIRTRASRSGRYQVPDVPPGDYFVIAIPDSAAADWPSPSFLSRLEPRAVRVAIPGREPVTRDLITVR